MVEIIGILAISWLLIWLFEKGNLSVLGLKPVKRNLVYAAVLFVTTALCCASGFLMRMYFGEEQFMLNPAFSLSLVFTGIWLNVKSVLFEELLCRGVGLYILIKKLGQKWGIVISAVIFGVLHWLNEGAFGNIIQMAAVFAFTFSMGLLLAYSYAKTFSLYLPIAIHLGWNLTQNFIFPDGPFGNQILLTRIQPEVTVSYPVYFSMLLLPKISAILTGFFVVRRLKPGQNK